MAIANVEGIEIYYELHGSGPLVLNISGSGNDLRVSRPDRDPLNKDFTVLHYDQRSLGQTSDVEATPTMADYANDGAALASSLGWENYHVVGTSFGGMVALNLIDQHPASVDKLVLRCTSPGGTMPSYPLHELADVDPAKRLEIHLGLMDTRYDPEAEEPIPGLGLYIDMARKQATTKVNAKTQAGSKRQLEARKYHDVQSKLGAIASLTLICAGRYDGLAPLANSEALLQEIPGSRLEIFEGGHAFMHQDHRAASCMRDFLLTNE